MAKVIGIMGESGSGKTTCTLNETDIQKVLFVAGIMLEEKKEKELEVM